MADEIKISNEVEAPAVTRQNDSGIEKTVRLTLNLLTNMALAATVFVCIVYSLTSPRIGVLQLHIILCVLGYQFFMCQGTLVLSKYNSWSMLLARGHRRHLHWVFQLIGCTFVTAGSVLMMKEMYANFGTPHGIFGLLALIMSILGLVNGMCAMHAYKLRSWFSPYWIKFIHYVTGIGTLFLASTCLCLGLDMASLRRWAGNETTMILMILTWFFTLLVALEFWITTGKMIRSSLLLNSKP